MSLEAEREGGARAAGPTGLPMLVGLSMVAALTTLQKVTDPDTWWHLAGGRLIFSSGLPAVNTFSHTWPDHPWQYTQWLFGVLLRLVELLGGPAATGLVPVVCVGAAVALSLDTVRRRLGRLPIVPLLPLLALILSASRFRFVPRPHLVTFVGLALVLNLYERRPRLLALWFGCIGAVWANSHAGVVFGLALVALMPVADALARRRSEARSGAVAAAAFLVGTLANPYGMYPYLYSFQHLSVQDIVPLDEFRHAAPAVDTTFLLLAAAALVAIPFRLRRKDFLYPLAAIAFFALAVAAVRVVPKFLLVILPGLATAAADGWAWLGARRRPAAAAALAALLAFVAGALVYRDFRMTRAFSPFGWGVEERLVPEGAARFILRHELAGEMFNDFDQGGYLAWRLHPGRRVFLDGRVQAYPPEFFREFRAAMHGDSWGAFLERYRVDYAVVQRRPYGSLIDLSRLFRDLAWPLVYLDGVSLIYVRPGSAAAAAVGSELFSLVAPGARDEDLVARARAAPATMLAELGRIDPARLLLSADFQSFGVAAAVAGDLVLAAKFLEAGVRAEPKNALLRLNLGTVRLDRGRREEALLEFRKAADLGAGTPAGDRARSRLAELEVTAPKRETGR